MMWAVVAAMVKELRYGTRSVPTPLGLWLLPLHAGNMMASQTIEIDVKQSY